MVAPTTGLPADNVSAEGVRAEYTSPTNIGMYIWSTLAARDLQIIKPREARDRIGKALDTLTTLERHTPSDQFYNWYNPSTGEKAFYGEYLLNAKLLNDPAKLRALTSQIPLGRLGQPDDVASLAVFLASSESRYVTGSTYFVDGGLSVFYEEQ